MTDGEKLAKKMIEDTAKRAWEFDNPFQRALRRQSDGTKKHYRGLAKQILSGLDVWVQVCKLPESYDDGVSYIPLAGIIKEVEK